MGHVNLIQTNFTGGEVSPLMYGRSDVNKYQNGAERIENFVVRPQGGVVRRTGTDFLSPTKYGDRQSVLRPFVFSNSQSYELEFGDFYIRIYKGTGLLLNAIGSPIEIVTPYPQSSLYKIHVSQSADVLYISHPDYQTRTLSRYSDSDWRLALFSTKDGPYLSKLDPDTTMTLSNISDTATLSITAGTSAGLTNSAAGTGFRVNDYIEFREDNLWRLGLVTAVAADGNSCTINYLSNLVLGTDTEKLVQSTTSYPNSSPGRYSPVNSFTVSLGVSLQADHSDVFSNLDVGKYIRSSPSANPGSGVWSLITGYAGNSGGSKVNLAAALTTKTTYSYPTTILTLTSHIVTATVTSSVDKFVATDVGRHMRFNFSSAQTWGIIQSFIDSKNVTIRLYESVPLDPLDPTKYSNVGATSDWKFGAWSDTTGWPALSVFHEQRLTFANTATEPQTIWMSQSSDYNNFAPTELDSSVLDNNAITYTIASNKLNDICWMESGPSMLVGTVGAEWQVKSAEGSGKPLSPSNVSVLPQSSYGSERFIRAFRIGNSVLFVQRAGRKVRELEYNFETDSFRAGDMTIISQHILEEGGGAVAAFYQSEPHSIFWVVRKDGALCGMTYDKDQDVNAWHVHYMGGTNAKVESICVVPDPTNSRDNLYMVVSRLVNGQIFRSVERVGTNFPQDDSADKTQANYLDCSLTYDGPPATTFSGLSHLEGETVGIYGDGIDFGTAVVTAGSVSLPATPSAPQTAAHVEIGLPYTSILCTLPPDGGNPLGTAEGKIKRPHKLAVRILNSIGMLYGPTEKQFSTLSFQESSDVMNQSPGLFTGTKVFFLDNTYDTDGVFCIGQSSPYPLTILALYTMSRVSENQ